MYDINGRWVPDDEEKPASGIYFDENGKVIVAIEPETGQFNKHTGSVYTTYRHPDGVVILAKYDFTDEGKWQQIGAAVGSPGWWIKRFAEGIIFTGLQRVLGGIGAGAGGSTGEGIDPSNIV